jgi:hypothetical protein
VKVPADRSLIESQLWLDRKLDRAQLSGGIGGERHSGCDRDRSSEPWRYRLYVVRLAGGC